MNSTNPDIDLDDATRSRVLAQAATVAASAPSIHNTQPWHWRIHDGVADLRAEPERHLTMTDPDRRMLIVSCGTALHHACVALAADGFTVEVQRLPEPDDTDLLARVAITGRTPVTASAMHHFQTIRIRHTDRRPLLDTPLPDGALDALRSAAAVHGIGLDPLDRGQTIELAAATDRAQRDEVDDQAARGELEAWSARVHPLHVGVPAANIPERPTLSTVPTRDFGHVGTLGITDDHDALATHAILYDLADEPASWLRAGEALSAVWLAAIEHGVALMPVSAAVQSPATRQTLRRLLGGIGYPCIAVRLGVADPQRENPPRTPRLPASATVEVIA